MLTGKNVSLSEDDISNELSEIADKIVKIIPVKKKLRNSTSLKKLKNENKKIMLSKKNEDNLSHNSNKNIRTSPKNLTFKTVFVNNFCLMPMSPSFISNKNIKYSKYNRNKNIYTFTSPQNDYNNKIRDNFSNYKQPILFNEEKEVKYNLLLQKNNSQYDKNKKGKSKNHINFNIIKY